MSVGKIGVIGSFELDSSHLLSNTVNEVITTPFGVVDVVLGKLGGVEVVHMTRAGKRHPLPSHEVNYRANITALAQLGVVDVITTAMAGSLRTALPVGSLILLDQFIDFTKKRPNTIYPIDDFVYMDFTYPYCPRMREGIIKVSDAVGVNISPNGCYVGVEGPRYETAAEVKMFSVLGGDVIGHTAVTECIMAREAGLCISTISGVVNLGAGLSNELLSVQTFSNPREQNLLKIEKVITGYIENYVISQADERKCTCSVQVHSDRQVKKNMKA